MEKTAPKHLYKPILKGIPHWPVYQLSKHKKEFLKEVTQESMRHIKMLRPDRKKLIDEIETVVFKELNRIKQRKPRIKASTEELFWKRIKEDTIKLQNGKADNTSLSDAILEKIIQKYTHGIAGDFKPNHYKFVRRITIFCFSRLLNGARINKVGAIFRTEYTLRNKINIVGKVAMIRRLAKTGTVVLVPTHFSHLDSIVIGWMIHFLGLPALIYGAGVNLFKIKIFAYFMNSLGAYKIDRKKKSLLYLETLKIYSSLALERGNHSLFFPGGTRSRSGSIETKLRRGMLSSAIQAQRNLCMKASNEKDSVRKIFVIPVTINYPVVLESPSLIRHYLQVKGQSRHIVGDNKYGSFQLIKFLIKFFTKRSTISVSVGNALDIVGNYVDEHGDSLDRHGNIIDTRDYFMSGNKIDINLQREDQYARMLCRRIVTEFYAIGEIYASHITAFIAFEIWRKQYDKLDLFGFLKIPEDEFCISYVDFAKIFEKVRNEIFKQKDEGHINCADHLYGDLNKVIKHGLDNIGIFHIRRPLLMDNKKNIITQDIVTLYYYRNRLDNYGFEKFI